MVLKNNFIFNICEDGFLLRSPSFDIDKYKFLWYNACYQIRNIYTILSVIVFGYGAK